MMTVETQLNELTVRMAEVLVHVRQHTRQLNTHGKQIDRLDQRADDQGKAIDRVEKDLASLGGLSTRITALEKWRYTIAGGYVCAGLVASYGLSWLHR